MYPPISLCTQCDAAFVTPRSCKPCIEVFPDIASRTRFGHEASPAERRMIPGLVNSIKDEVVHCDIEIDRLELLLGEIKARKRVLEHNIDTYRSLESIVHSIPSEILMKVFTHCVVYPIGVEYKTFPYVPDDEDTIFDALDKGVMSAFSPLNLSRVCGRWRDISLSMPSLWYVIRLGQIPLLDDRRMKRRRRNALNILKLFFHNSGSLGIWLSFKCHCNGGSFVNYITQNSDRIFGLEMELDQSFFWIFEAFFPTLVCMDVALIDCNNSVYISTTVVPSAQFPALRHFRSVYGEQLPQIESLTLLMFKRDQLTLHPNLKRLTIDTDFSSSDDAVLNHENVETLVLPDSSVLKATMKFPQLTSLWVGYDHSHTIFPLRSEGMNLLASCRLEHLVLGNVYVDELKLSQLFDAVPSLTKLEIGSHLWIEPTTKCVYSIIPSLKNLQELKVPLFESACEDVGAMLRMHEFKKITLINVPHTVGIDELYELRDCSKALVEFYRV